METINERIKALVTALGYKSLDSFDKSLGRARSTTKNITGPRQTKPGYDYLDKILEVFPQVDANWLFRNKGDMFFPEKTKLEYVENLEQKLAISERANRRYEAALDIVAQRNFQPLSEEETPVREIYVLFENRNLKKTA